MPSETVEPATTASVTLTAGIPPGWVMVYLLGSRAMALSRAARSKVSTTRPPE
jgi:hypothetical protein